MTVGGFILGIIAVELAAGLILAGIMLLGYFLITRILKRRNPHV